MSMPTEAPTHSLKDKEVATWTVDDVCTYLNEIGLGVLEPKARENALSGSDLVELTQDELQHDLDITRLQARKMKQMAGLPHTAGAPTELGSTEGSIVKPAGMAMPLPDTDLGRALSAGRLYQNAPGSTPDQNSAPKAEPPPGYPPQGAPPAGYPPQGAPPPGYPPQAAPAPGYPAIGAAPPVYPHQAAPAPGYPPQGATPPGYPPQGAPGYPPQGAPPPAQPPPQFAPTAPLMVVDVNTTKQWADKVELIHRLEAAQVAIRLPAARERLNNLNTRAKTEQKTLTDVQAQLVKQQGKVKELDDGDWYPGKYLIGKKGRAKKIAEAEDKEKDLQKQVNAISNTLEDLCKKRAAAMNEVEALDGDVKTLSAAKQWEENLLRTVFDGPGGDSRENFIEQEYNSMAPRLQEIRLYKQKYSQAYELIRGARKDLSKACELLQSAVGLATADVVMGVRPGMRARPGNMMVDVMKQAQMRQGGELLEAACDQCIKALQIIPDMPKMQLAKAKALKGLGLMDFLFSSVIVDLIVRQKIVKALGMAKDMLEDVKDAERWLQGWIDGRINIDLRQMESAYAAKKAELDAVRRDILQRAANQIRANEAAQGMANASLI